MIYGYDTNRINIMTFDLAQMLPEERKDLCRMISGFIDQMKSEHRSGGLQSAPKFLGLLSKTSTFNLWFEAGVPVVTLLKN
mgnify:CR=1 FL=1